MAVKTITQGVAEIVPRWLSQGNAQKYIGVVAGLNRDKGLEADTFAVHCGLLNSPGCPVDAVANIGTDRSLPKLPGETQAQYTSRVQQAWRAWMFAGSGTTIKEQLGIMGLTVEIKWANSWNFGTLPGWRYYWVIVRSHPFDPAPTWGDFTWGDGTIWGGDAATAQGIQSIKRILRTFEPAHMQCHSIVVVYDLVTWDATPPDGTWEVAANRPPPSVAVFFNGS